ncbi:MAG: Dam family site-specific DNA-(adenine-N6)-methyltransferase [Dehalococcoidia bacterium]|jgi:DNA adenine methylase|nr:MAG: DNA adenine methylase [Chloroflexota bacterium]|tara:strand:+ start:9451 stop:10311 length:861 start_codon:yes stop_codon:yes gene_type:complete
MSELAKPFLKWAGGKSSIAPILIDNLPNQFNNYFEPMVGAGALFLNVIQNVDGHRKFFIGDINKDLISTYKVIKNNLSALKIYLSKYENKYLAYKNEDREKFFYSIRSQEPKTVVEIAARFIFLNKTCFNGLYRVNRKGHFNVPHGKYVSPKIFDENNLNKIAILLKKVHFNTADVKTNSQLAQSNDFVYLDPPFYPISKTASFTSYTSKKFGEGEQLKLKLVIDELTKKQVYVMLSNSDHPWIIGAYQASGYKLQIVKARRSLSSNVSSRGKVNELVITNYHLID